MNAQLSEMIRAKDANRRAKLAVLVQADIERVARGYLAVVERQHQIVQALVDAGLTHIPGTDEPVTFEGTTDEVGAGLLVGGKGAAK